MKHLSTVLPYLFLSLAIWVPVSALNAAPATLANAVSKDVSATTTTLAVSAGILGQPIVFSVTVQAPAAAGSPVGNIELIYNGQLFGVPTLSPTNSGDDAYAESVATWTFTAGDALYITNYTITADFVGNSNFSDSSNSQSFDVTAPTYNYLPDGVGIDTVVTGSGEGIETGQVATVYYTGFYASSGEEFDESYSHLPGTLEYTNDAGQVITGFDEGTLGMEVGETRVVYVPSAEGYNDGKDRIFVIQLLAINGVPSFDNTTPPIFSITTPAESGELVDDAEFTVAGTAQDSVAVTNVQVSLNGGSWLLATVDDEGNWSEPVNLVLGTNTIDAYAVDTNGNVSFDDEVQVDCTSITPPPVITITTPFESGLQVVSTKFTVAGTAEGSVTVTNVLVSLNGGSWLPATVDDEGNWSEPVSLAFGTNTIDAYAVDANGTVSSTNEVEIDCLVKQPPPGRTLTVETIGEGSIFPNDNGLTLTIGTTYTMMATPAKGFVFTDWTDGLGDVLTNGENLIFEMSSNLVLIANFHYTLNPILAITSPKTDARWSNNVYTVTGTVRNSYTVSNVLVSINAGAWTNASLTDGNSNWTAQVNLNAGTNTISAYAATTSGYESPTNTVKLIYIVSDRLTVNTVGNGKVNPDYNNATLAISNLYTMKATPAKGFGFNFWNVGGTISNNPTLNFIMASNLVITANFKDTEVPTIKVALPKANAKYGSAVISVSGTASDNVGVVGVKVQLNANGWMTATGTSSWTASLSSVVLGANTVSAYAFDAAGNISKTNIVKFTGVAPLN